MRPLLWKHSLRNVSPLGLSIWKIIKGFLEWSIINKTLEAADRAQTAQPPREPLSKAAELIPTRQPSIKLSALAALPHRSSQSASSSRPVIKLKVGLNTKSSYADTPSQQQSPPPQAQPKSKKQRQPVAIPDVDLPPPPYVDDGSHDILQEVLAMEREREKGEERMRLHSEREKTMQHTNSSKRKKNETVENDDDVLALASPAKKERSSPSTARPSPAEKSNTPMPTSTISKVQTHKTTKKEKPLELKHTTSSKEVFPKSSVKGKEKEVPPPASIPVAPSKAKKLSVIQATPINEKKCKELLKSLLKIPEAGLFSSPVDPIRDGCPTYVSRLLLP